MIVVSIDPGATIGFAHCRAVTRDLHWLTLGSYRRESEVMESICAAVTMAGDLPVIVAVESVESVFGRARFGAAMGTGLVRAARQTGVFVELARARGALVLEVPAARWRKGLTGRGNATDAQIKIALHGLLRGVRTNAHVRDALGLARHAWLWATKTPDGIEAVRCHEWKGVLGP